jgi:hypothetical protein
METQTCPKCGFLREPQALDCPVCGVVYAKFDRGAAAPRPAPASPGSASAATPPPLPPANPYAAPRASLSFPGPPPGPQTIFQGGVWRSGDILVVGKGYQLPGRCVVCNRETSLRWQKTFSWAPRWVRLLILVQVFIYLIVYLSVRKQANLAVPLCQEHEDKRKRDTTLSWVLVLGGLLLMFGCIVFSDNSNLLLAVLFLGLISLIVGVVLSARGNVLQPVTIDDRYCWLKKGGPEYLANLPQAPAGV